MKFYFKIMSLLMIGFTGYFFISKPGQILDGLRGQNLLESINNPMVKSLGKSSAENFYFSYIQGDNLIHTREKSFMAENNIDLRVNDEIFTGSKSYSTLTFKNNSKIRIDEGSSLIIRNIPARTPSGLYILDLKKGGIMLDFSDESGKYAVKIQLDNYSIYTRKSTLYVSKKGPETVIAVDYGAVKIKELKTEKSIFVSSAQGVTITNGKISDTDKFPWVDTLPWDQYFHDLNRTGRNGPFTMKTSLLSQRDEQLKRKRGNNIEKIARNPSKVNVKVKKHFKSVDEAISKNGGALLEKLPFYGEKIKNIKDQINLNTDAMEDRDKMLENLD